jgi:hypothetical protein
MDVAILSIDLWYNAVTIGTASPVLILWHKRLKGTLVPVVLGR